MKFKLIIAATLFLMAFIFIEFKPSTASKTIGLNWGVSSAVACF